MAIAENAGNLPLAADSLHQLRRKSFAISREVTPVEHDGRSRDLPMAGGSVLAVRHLVCRAIKPEKSLWQRHSGGIVAVRHLGDVEQTERRHIGKLERSLPQAGPVARAGGTEFRDVAKRIGSQVAVV